MVQSWVILIFGILFLALNTFLAMVLPENERRQQDAHARFQPIEAEMLVSEVVKHRGRGANPRTNYRPKFRYRYTVDGRRHTSTRYQYAGDMVVKARAVRPLVARYPVGAVVTAYVDPKNPNEAVLNTKPPPPGQTGMLLAVLWVFGGGTTLFGLVLLIRAWRSPHANEQAPAAD